MTVAGSPVEWCPTVVVGGVNVGATPHQEADEGGPAMLGGKHEWRLPLLVAEAEVGTLANQQLGNLPVSLLRRVVQRSVAVLVKDVEVCSL